MSKILGIVPARKGSKRLPNKNMLPIEGEPMAIRAYKTLKESVCDRVVVATDIPELLENKDVYTIRRPERLNGDDVNVQEVAWWVLKAMYNYDICVVLFPTNPLIEFRDVNMAIEILKKRNLNIVRSYRPQTSEENGLYVFRTNMRESKGKIYDVHSGMILLPGDEIHTMEEYKFVKGYIENAT